MATKPNRIRRARCAKFNYAAVDVMHYLPRITMVTSDELIRVHSVEAGQNDDPKNLKKVMLVLTINEALELAAALNREAVKAALGEP